MVYETDRQREREREREREIEIDRREGGGVRGVEKGRE